MREAIIFHPSQRIHLKPPNFHHFLTLRELSDLQFENDHGRNVNVKEKTTGKERTKTRRTKQEAHHHKQQLVSPTFSKSGVVLYYLHTSMYIR
jgi:hypothetical protein